MRLERFRTMRNLFMIALFTLATGGVAAAQQSAPAPYVYTPPPQQPPQTSTVPHAPVVGIPFGALYNVISGSQPARNSRQQPLTPFNAAPATP
jgi:hypothetical protein